MAEIYVGTYCNNGDDSIFVFDYDENTRKLQKTMSSNLLDNPSYLVAEPAGKWICAVSETDTYNGTSGGAAALLAKSQSKIALMDIKPTYGGAPCHVMVSEKENMLLVSNYFGGSISVYQTHNGRLEMVQLVQHYGRGPHAERQEAPHVHFCARHDGKVFCADLGLDALMCYSFCDDQLVHKRAQDIHFPKGSGVRHFITSTLYKDTLFAVCELTSEVMMVDVSAPTGGKIMQTVSTLPHKCDSTCAAIKQTADGEYVFASNRGHNSIAVMRLCRNEKRMELVDIVNCEGLTPRDFLVLGNSVLVANQDSDAICIFEFDPRNGKLKYTGDSIHCPKPVCITAV